MSVFLLVLILVVAAGAAAYLLTRRRKPVGPEAAIDRFLAELESRQAEAAQAVHRVVTAYKEVRDRVRAYDEEAQRWGDQAREALRAGDEATARDRLERQVRAEHAAEALRGDLEALQDAQARADAHYRALKEQWESARVRYTSLAARRAAASAQGSLLDFGAEERRARDAYDRLQESVADAEARAAAITEVAGAGRIYEDPSEIDRRLAQLRG